MAVFFRRRGIADTKTKWKKYSVAYSGTATSLKIAKTGTNIAGDYIEDVEDENASAYPDNGPLGLYWYIKQ